MKRIVSIGECMIEMAPNGNDGGYQLGFAGDTLNTAWYLRQLLPPTIQIDYFTAVGCDSASDQMVRFIADTGIGTAHIARRDGATVGLYMIQLSEGERSFSYWRGQSAARTLAHDAGPLADALTGADVAYFSGITLAILPPEDRERFLDVLSTFRRDGGVVVFDPNLRPRLWPSVADMTANVMKAAAVSDIVLPSYDDEAEWFGDADPQATAQRYAKAGVSTVIVKNGPGQILALQDGALTHHAPVTVDKIVDTTAAGDSFNAGFLADWAQGRSTDQAINAGSALAARVIQYRGALVPLP
ncbi:2-dehydro-3-deoxygluconokinase [Sulfitobacter marinus]|uniref:2-dehydro-3-deoxygluconokinase n=1 Tax=Sulfitobacter marinus TaxID=394264 RepID=A0A1I6PR12_9RHOB|nr:sugar kinase [Sulfitobacter marinus]SFS42631.1 2-dehydro-3-deoxygluconokinase [Sulfitobacter marinus]